MDGSWRATLQLRARAGVLTALLSVSAGAVYLFGGTRFEYACGLHDVPGSVAGATVLGCLTNPWSHVGLAIAGTLGLCALVAAFVAWRLSRRALVVESVKTAGPAPTPPARR